jgi:hypothetical protein
MDLRLNCILFGISLALLGCSRSAVPPEAMLRSCMGNHARAVALAEKRRPSFEETKQFAKLCGAGSGAEGAEAAATMKVAAAEIDTLACAYSEQWNRCRREPPSD